MSQRSCLRPVGFLYKMINKINIDNLTDPRDARGRQWYMPTMIKAVLYGIMSGQKSLRQVEQTTEELSESTKKLLRIKKRLPDTTLRDFLVALQADTVLTLLYRCVHQAIRRKSLSLATSYPIHVLAMDGKVVTPRFSDPAFTQRHHDANSKEHYELKTITSCLISTPSKPCVGVSLVPPEANEKGHFITAFKELLRVYGNKFFKIVTYDAGGNSLENATHVHKSRKFYFFL